MEFNVATEKGCILLGYWVSEKGSREKTTHRSVFADLKLNNFQNTVSICSAWKLKENHHHLKITSKLDIKQKAFFFLQWVSDYGRKEGNVLFNDALNTFYLRL